MSVVYFAFAVLLGQVVEPLSVNFLNITFLPSWLLITKLPDASIVAASRF